MGEPRQTIVTLDLEGVLVPEIWIAVAKRTGIAALRRTTRDEPDYDVLMKYRIALLAEHGLTMSLIQDVIAGLAPLPGAVEFLDELRGRTQVVLLSDTFEQFAEPLMRQLGHRDPDLRDEDSLEVEGDDGLAQLSHGVLCDSRSNGA